MFLPLLCSRPALESPSASLHCWTLTWTWPTSGTEASSDTSLGLFCERNPADLVQAQRCLCHDSPPHFIFINTIIFITLFKTTHCFTEPMPLADIIVPLRASRLLKLLIRTWTTRRAAFRVRCGLKKRCLLHPIVACLVDVDLPHHPVGFNSDRKLPKTQRLYLESGRREACRLLVLVVQLHGAQWYHSSIMLSLGWMQNPSPTASM